MPKILKLQDLSFGIITKLMAFRASSAVLRMFSARFVTLLSADAVHLELSHISLVELFSDRKEQLLGLVCQYVKMMCQYVKRI